MELKERTTNYNLSRHVTHVYFVTWTLIEIKATPECDYGPKASRNRKSTSFPKALGTRLTEGIKILTVLVPGRMQSDKKGNNTIVMIV